MDQLLDNALMPLSLFFILSLAISIVHLASNLLEPMTIVSHFILSYNSTISPTTLPLALLTTTSTFSFLYLSTITCHP